VVSGERDMTRDPIVRQSDLPSVTPTPTSRGASAVGRGNRGRDTAPEMAVRQALHRQGLRYRVGLRLSLPAGAVRPDIVFIRQRVAVFIDGCFWHGCPQHGTRPRSNRRYWDAKLARNRARDKRDTARLEAAGWRVLRVWEHVDAEVAGAMVKRVLERS
jgi:DNA mismatch endonuclease (patch repair protein)